MARGWESKSVADQIEEGKDRQPEARTPYLSPAARAQQERLQSLHLSRTRTLNQLERATSRNHRHMLEQALQSLEREIEEISNSLKEGNSYT